jgi:hypothetical protein
MPLTDPKRLPDWSVGNAGIKSPATALAKSSATTTVGAYGCKSANAKATNAHAEAPATSCAQK